MPTTWGLGGPRLTSCERQALAGFPLLNFPTQAEAARVLLISSAVRHLDERQLTSRPSALTQESFEARWTSQYRIAEVSALVNGCFRAVSHLQIRSWIKKLILPSHFEMYTSHTYICPTGPCRSECSGPDFEA